MLASFIVLLRPIRTAPVGRNLGRYLHGLLLKLVAAVDAELADHLHPGGGQRPFTVSTLNGRWSKGGGRRLALADEAHSVRYTVLTDSMFSALGWVLSGKYVDDQPVHIDGQPFAIRDISVDPRRSDGWAELTTYEDLIRQAGGDRRICLHFASPTAFHTGDIQLLFPLCRSVFGSYLRKWESFSSIPLSVDLLDFAAQFMQAEHFSLDTRELPLRRRFRHKGFPGYCQYQVIADDQDMIRQLNALADFALFAGTGWKTTHGFGQTRRVRPE